MIKQIYNKFYYQTIKIKKFNIKKKYNIILKIVDRLTKYFYIILLKKKYRVE